MSGQLLNSVPILPAQDFDRTATFYAQLGFAEVARLPEEYLILRRDGAELHFRPAAEHETDPAASHFRAYIRVLNAPALDRDWSGLGLPDTGIPRLTRFTGRAWGMTEAYLVDPDGTLITFGAATSEPATKD